ncbi:MAG: lamin tail domain-containing protein [Bacillota bacterium]|nr:lamin tail domain-containing protein [Bacillota bacterium]
MKRLNCVLSVILVIAMVATMMPLGAYAANDDSGTQTGGTSYANSKDSPISVMGTDGSYPGLIITEVVNSSYKPEGVTTSADGYDIIEVYNTTNSSINLKGYKVGRKNTWQTSVTRPGGVNDYVTPVTGSVSYTGINDITADSRAWGEYAGGDCMLPAHGVATLWVRYYTTGITNFTDFKALDKDDLKAIYPDANTNYTFLCEDDYGLLPGDTLDAKPLTSSTTGAGVDNQYRGQFLLDNPGSTTRVMLMLLTPDATAEDESSAAKYTDNDAAYMISYARYFGSDVTYLTSDGGTSTAGVSSAKFYYDLSKNQSMILESKTAPSVGTMTYKQKPTYNDTNAPVMSDVTASTYNPDNGADITIGVTDDKDIRLTSLFYRTSKDTAFKEASEDIVLRETKKNSIAADITKADIAKNIPAEDLAGADYIEYYATALDGGNNPAAVGSASAPIRINAATAVSKTNVAITYPVDMSVFTGSFNGILTADLSDKDGIDTSSATITVDNGTPISVPAQNVSNTALTYSFAGNPLGVGTHTIKLQVHSTNQSKDSGEATVTIGVTEGSSTKDGDYPDLMITEAKVYTTQVQGVDAYSAVEIYNASGHPINLNNYKLGRKADWPGAGNYDGDIANLTNTYYTGMNGITKYSAAWSGNTEPSGGNWLPANGVATLWVRYYPMSKFTDAAAFKALGVDSFISENPTVNKDSLFLAEDTYGLNAGDDQTSAAAEPEPKSASDGGVSFNKFKNIYLKRVGSTTRVMLLMLDSSATVSEANRLKYVDDDSDIMSVAKYFGSDVSTVNSSVKFKYDSAKNYLPVSEKLSQSNLGVITYDQKPIYVSDKTAAEITDNTGSSFKSADGAKISINMFDNRDLRYSTIYYKTSKDTDFKSKSIDYVAQKGSVASDTQLAEQNISLTAEELTDVDYIDYYVTAIDGGGNTATLGSSAMPHRMINESSNHTIVNITSPTEGESFSGYFRDTLTADLVDGDGIDASTAQVVVDGGTPIAVPSENVTDKTLTYSFASHPLTKGDHTITVKVNSKNTEKAAGEATVHITVTEAAVKRPDLVMTEVNAAPGGTGNLEYFELYNTGNRDIPLSDVQFNYLPYISDLSKVYTNPWVTETQYDDKGNVVPFVLKKNQIYVVFIYQQGAQKLGYRYDSDAEMERTWNELFKSRYGVEIPKTNRIMAPYTDSNGTVIKGAANLWNSINAKTMQIVDKSTKAVLCQAVYNDGAVQCATDQTIDYVYFDGCDPVNNCESLLVDYTGSPTPGTLRDYQQPNFTSTAPPSVDCGEVEAVRQPDDTTFTAKVTDPDNDIKLVYLFYKTDQMSGFSCAQMAKTENADEYRVSISINAIKDSKSIEYYIIATDGASSAFAPQFIDNPYKQTIADTEGPHIDSITPANGANIQGRINGQIVITYSDYSGVDKNSIKFWFNGEDVTDKCSISDYKLTYNMGLLTQIGAYTSKLQISDKYGTEVDGKYPEQRTAIHENSFNLIPIVNDHMPSKEIIHAPMNSTIDSQDLAVQALVIDSSDSNNLTLQYITDDGKSGTLSMAKDTALSSAGNGVASTYYTASIPVSVIKGRSYVKYCITSSGNTEMRAPSSDGSWYQTALQAATVPPELMITEMQPNPDGNDDVEFIEIYNTSNKELDLMNYKINFQPYPQTAPNDYRFVNFDMMMDSYGFSGGKYIINPGEVVVVHLFTSDARKTGMTLDSFREDSRINLSESNTKVIELPADTSVDSNRCPLPNTLVRKVMLNYKSNPNVGPYICVATYNDELSAGYSDSLNGLSVTYGAPIDGTINLHKLEHGAVATPGKIDWRQKAVNYNDKYAPYIIHQKPVSDGAAPQEITLTVQIFDEAEIIHKSIYYRTYGTEGWQTGDLTPVAGKDNLFQFTVSYDYLQYTNKLEYYFAATDGLHEAVLKSQSGDPFTITYKDVAPPQVGSFKPENYYFYEDSKIPVVKAYIEDNSGINKASIHLYMDDIDETKDTVILEQDRGFNVAYTPGVAIADGRHTLKLVAADLSENKNVLTQVTEFSIGDDSKLNHYRGEVHSHTQESDGTGTVEQAYEWARYHSKLDYFSVTDHNDMLTTDVYKNQLKRTKKYNQNGPGGFIVFNGWETTYYMNTGWFGHFNMLNVDWLKSDPSIPARQYYDFGIADPNAVMQFNHPGNYDGNNWGDFNDFGYYSTQADDKFALIEFNANVSNDDEYNRALFKGWHVSPVVNEDNHQMFWGSADPSSGVAMAPALTRDNIIEAFRKNRTYAAGDDNIIMEYKVNGKWMGSILKDPDKLDIDLKIYGKDINNIPAGTVSIVTDAQVTVFQKTYTAADAVNGVIHMQYQLPADYKYCYIKHTRTVGASTITSITAPVWVEKERGINIDSLDLGLSSDTANPDAVKTIVKNTSDDNATNLTLSYYLGTVDGFTLSSDIINGLNGLQPLAVRSLSSLGAGETATVGVNMPRSLDSRRIFVLLSGVVNGKLIRDVKYITPSPIYITEIVADSSDYVKGGVVYSRPFNYIEVYNNDNVARNLKGLAISTFVKAGQTAAYNTAKYLDKYSISEDLMIGPRQAMVLWIKDGITAGANNSLTVADFNKYYGTNFDTIYQFVKSPLDQSGSRILSVNLNDDTDSPTPITCIKYNVDESLNLDVVENKGITYTYNSTGIDTSIKLSNRAVPTPGVVVEGQVPNYSNDYSLSSVKLVYAGGETNVNLSDKNTSYRVSVPEGVKSVTCIPETKCPTLNLKINGVKVCSGGFIDAGSGNTFPTLNLNKTGATAVVEVLNDSDKTVATYTFSVGSGDLNIDTDNGSSGASGGTSGGADGSSGSSGGTDTSGGTTGDSGTTAPTEGNASTPDFSDTSNHWASEAIKYIADKGIIKGYEDGTFKPDATVNRGDFTLMLMRSFAGDKSGTGTFNDVDPNAYYAGAVAAAKDLGIATGSDGAFNPKTNVTRQDMFVLFARTLRAFNLLDEKADISKVTFSDSDSIADYAKDDILLLAANGYINGTEGKINPTGTATRAETAQMLYNYFTKHAS